MTKLFIEQPLASPGSAKKMETLLNQCYASMNILHWASSVYSLTPGYWDNEGRQLEFKQGGDWNTKKCYKLFILKTCPRHNSFTRNLPEERRTICIRLFSVTLSVLSETQTFYFSVLFAVHSVQCVYMLQCVMCGALYILYSEHLWALQRYSSTG